MRIVLLTGLEYSSFFNYRQDPYFPLRIYSKQFRQSGYTFKNIWSHSLLKRSHGDLLILPNRYFYHRDWASSDIIDLVQSLKGNFKRIAWLDMGDSSGSQDFGIINYVDLFFKKQLLKDISSYCKSNYSKNFRIWLDENNYKHEGLIDDDLFCALDKEQTTKLRLWWNIGLTDYWSDSKLRILDSSSKKFKLYIKRKKSLVTVYRGTIGTSTIYNKQRMDFLSYLKDGSQSKDIIVGGMVTRKDYIKELCQSEYVFSPFGWGEICYRDFEAVLSNAVLIKPKMDHIDTFPNIYVKDAYVPVEWNLSNLEGAIDLVQKESNRKKIHSCASDILMESYDFAKIKQHLQDQLE